MPTGRGRAPHQCDLTTDSTDAAASLCHSNPSSVSPLQTRAGRRRGSPKSDGIRIHPLTSRGGHYLCGGHNAPGDHTHVVARRPKPRGPRDRRPAPPSGGGRNRRPRHHNTKCTAARMWPVFHSHAVLSAPVQHTAVDRSNSGDRAVRGGAARNRGPCVGPGRNGPRPQGSACPFLQGPLRRLCPARRGAGASSG